MRKFEIKELVDVNGWKNKFTFVEDLTDEMVKINEPKSTENERSIEIVQLTSMTKSDDDVILEDEIERLKKIIQIILNKQAELI